MLALILYFFFTWLRLLVSDRGVGVTLAGSGSGSCVLYSDDVAKEAK